MHSRLIGIMTAASWATVLSAQTAPPQFMPPPQFTASAPASVVNPEAERILRELLTKYTQGETAVCSVPLLEVPVAKNVERMPTLHPRADNIDHMVLVKLPAPPCKEELR